MFGNPGYILSGKEVQSDAEAERALFQYIEIYYNRHRKHSTNGYKTPSQYEQEWWENRRAA
jgi:transposase InsO family protein